MVAVENTHTGGGIAKRVLGMIGMLAHVQRVCRRFCERGTGALGGGALFLMLNL